MKLLEKILIENLISTLKDLNLKCKDKEFRHSCPKCRARKILGQVANS